MRAPLVSLGLSLLSLLLVSACEKSSSPGDISPPKDPATAASAKPVASQAPATPSATAAAETATATPPPSTPSVAPSATVAAAKGKDAGAASVQSASAAALRPASKHVGGKNFSIDLTSPGCKAGTDCAVTIKLVTAGDFHVNKEYPYKFVANASPNVTFLGKSDPSTFTRAAGDFVEQGEKTGTMTVRFKAAAPGDAPVTGTYKFSVCSAEQCQIEQEKLDLTVPVM